MESQYKGNKKSSVEEYLGGRKELLNKCKSVVDNFLEPLEDQEKELLEDREKAYEFLESQSNLQNVNVQNEWMPIAGPNRIQRGVQECADFIDEKFGDKNVVVACILKGASYFFVDLTRKLKIPHSAYFIEFSSYMDSQTQQEVEQLSIINPDKFKDKYVILIDELYDGGKTLDCVKHKISEQGGVPFDKIFTCTLFMKYRPNSKEEYPKPNLCGMLVPDVWLVGYGLDDKQEKRNWPCLYACPKESSILKTPHDAIFESYSYYMKILKKTSYEKNGVVLKNDGN